MNILNKIRFGLILVLISTLIISIIVHTCTLIYIEQNVFDGGNLISLILIISLVLNYRITTYFLILFSIIVLSFEFAPQILNFKTLEKIYYDISIGSSASSYLRVNIIHKNSITRFLRDIFGGLHLLLTFYIIVIEVPYRQYKKKLFPSN